MSTKDLYTILNCNYFKIDNSYYFYFGSNKRYYICLQKIKKTNSITIDIEYNYSKHIIYNGTIEGINFEIHPLSILLSIKNKWDTLNITDEYFETLLDLNTNKNLKYYIAKYISVLGTPIADGFPVYTLIYDYTKSVQVLSLTTKIPFSMKAENYIEVGVNCFGKRTFEYYNYTTKEELSEIETFADIIAIFAKSPRMLSRFDDVNKHLLREAHLNFIDKLLKYY